MTTSQHHNQITNRVSPIMAKLPWASATILSLIMAGCGTLSLFPPIHLGTTIQQAEIPSLKGVIVTAAGEAAQTAGLEKNDIIVRLANKPITNLSDLRAALNALSGNVEVEVYRPKMNVPEEPMSPLAQFLGPLLRKQNPVKRPAGSWHVITLTLPESSLPPDNPPTSGTNATDQSAAPDQPAIEVDQLEPIGSVQTMTPKLAELVGYANWRGVRVKKILDKSEAQAKGLLVGDIIIGFGHSLEDEKMVKSTDGFRKMISDNTDQEVMLRYVRGQVPYTTTVTLNLYEPPAGSTTSVPDLGLVVVDDGGVRIKEVLLDSPSAQAGLLEGDLITVIDFQPVATADQFWTMIIDKMDQQMIQVEIQRDGLSQYISLQLPPSG